MVAVAVRSFDGLYPIIGKESLPNEAAQVAVNCRLEGADLESWKGGLDILALTSTNPVKTIYRYNIGSPSETAFWFQWDTDVNVVKGPIAGDTEERTYWTGDGAYPKKTRSDIATTAPPYPANHFRLGIPRPTVVPAVAISGTATDPNSAADTAAWGYTYVTTWDEEGPMSPLTALATWRPGQTPNLSNLGTAAPTGPYSINRKRIYRSNSGTSTTDLQFVTEVAVTVGTFADTVLTSLLGAVSVTRNFTPPPDDIAGLCVMANGMMAAFSQNTVYFCEPGIPYAWPTRYAYPYDAPVVAIAPYGGSLLVMTKRGTYLLTGNDPAAMGGEQIKYVGTCLSKRGVTPYGDGIIYPVKLGLQYIGPDGVSLLTKDHFDERGWGAYSPETFTSALIAGRYVAFFDTGAKQGGLIITFNPLKVVETTLFGTAAWTEQGTERMYFVLPSKMIQRWDAGTALSYTWRSKAYRYVAPESWVWGKVEGDAYPVTIRVYANGALLHTQTVADKFAFILPAAGNQFDRWEFELAAATRITAVTFTSSMAEMKKL